MRKPIPLLLAAFTLACSGGGSDEQPPAASLSLAELAARNVATTITPVEPPPAPPASIYQNLREAVESGALSPMDADRMLMPLFFGADGEVSAEFRPEGAEAGVPDLALFWMMRRLPSYPPEVQEEIRGWLPAERARRVAADFDRWNLLSPRAAFAAPPQPTAGSCSSTALPGSFVNLGETDVQVGGASVRIAVCASTPDHLDIATDVLFHAIDAIGEMNGFFGSDISNISMAPAPEVQLFLSDGAITTREGDTASHGYMSSCRDIAINRTLPRCELESTIVHELFHCLHMRSQGYSIDYLEPDQSEERIYPGNWAGRVPPWVAEGAAVWAEDRFDTEDHTNAEWEYHQWMAEIPHESLEDREYSSGVFFNFVQQHGGGDAAVRALLQRMSTTGSVGASGGPDATALEDLLTWPDVWFEFSDALSGFDPLYDQGRKKLDDQPLFPYLSSANCSESVSVTQEQWARRLPLDPFSGHAYDLDVPHLSISYEILELTGGSSAQYVDVGFGGKLVERVEEGDVLVTAILRTDTGETIEDWSDRWISEGGDFDSITLPPTMSDTETDGRFRICLTDEVEGCFERPDSEIHRGLYEIDIIIANAGTAEEDDITGTLVVLPGALPGWKAERVEPRPGYEDQP